MEQKTIHKGSDTEMWLVQNLPIIRGYMHVRVYAYQDWF